MMQIIHFMSLGLVMRISQARTVDLAFPEAAASSSSFWLRIPTFSSFSPSVLAVLPQFVLKRYYKGGFDMSVKARARAHSCKDAECSRFCFRMNPAQIDFLVNGLEIELCAIPLRSSCHQ